MYVCGVCAYSVSVGSEQRGLLELLGGCRDLDVLASLQPLLTLNQVVDAINHRLHQVDLREGSITF